MVISQLDVAGTLWGFERCRFIGPFRQVAVDTVFANRVPDFVRLATMFGLMTFHAPLREQLEVSSFQRMGIVARGTPHFRTLLETKTLAQSRVLVIAMNPQLILFLEGVQTHKIQ